MNITKTILCFGDSNTWGMSPDGSRYSEQQRWTAILSRTLSKNYNVIEAGEPNRTLMNGSPFESSDSNKASGKKYSQPYLANQQVSLVIVMLGTNDLKKRFAHHITQIAEATASLVEQIWQYSEQTYQQRCKVLVVAPTPIYEVGAYKSIYQGGELKSKQLVAELLKISQKIGCDFLDAGSIVSACKEEGVHWPEQEHMRFAKALASKIAMLY